MRPLGVAATLVILSQLLIAQDDKTVQAEGRVIGTTINDQGEPIANVLLCTSVVQPQSSRTSCDARSDEHGQFDIRVPLETNRIYGENRGAGYWHDSTPHNGTMPDSGMQITLSHQAPTAHVVIKLGPSPAHLTINISDKSTGKAVDSAIVRWIVIDDSPFATAETTKKEISVPPDKDVLIIVQAPGYRRWFYSDPSSPSQPTCDCTRERKERSMRNWIRTSSRCGPSQSSFDADRFPHRPPLHSHGSWGERGERHSNFPWGEWSLAEPSDRGGCFA